MLSVLHGQILDQEVHHAAPVQLKLFFALRHLIEYAKECAAIGGSRGSREFGL